MSACDLQVTRALLPCEFKSSGSAEVSRECRRTSFPYNQRRGNGQTLNGSGAG
jgi:hypothetical protein